MLGLKDLHEEFTGRSRVADARVVDAQEAGEHVGSLDGVDYTFDGSNVVALKDGEKCGALLLDYVPSAKVKDVDARAVVMSYVKAHHRGRGIGWNLYMVALQCVPAICTEDSQSAYSAALWGRMMETPEIHVFGVRDDLGRYGIIKDLYFDGEKVSSRTLGYRGIGALVAVLRER